MGGPYSNREDAERAIRAGNFDQDPAELVVQEGESEDDGSPKTASWGPFQTPTTEATTSPSTPDMPELGQPMPETQFPKTTKPSQTPGGGGGTPQDPASDQFDSGPMETPGSNSLASTTAAVVAMIRESNPGIDDETLIAVASRAVEKLADFHPYSMTPNIEDPLHGRNPLGLIKDVTKTLPGQQKGKPQQPDESQDEEDGEDEDEQPRQPFNLPRMNLPGFDSGMPMGEEASRARMLPMLMV